MLKTKLTTFRHEVVVIYKYLQSTKTFIQIKGHGIAFSTFLKW